LLVLIDIVNGHERRLRSLWAEVKSEEQERYSAATPVWPLGQLCRASVIGDRSLTPVHAVADAGAQLGILAAHKPGATIRVGQALHALILVIHALWCRSDFTRVGPRL
jgi:hypothetical protein